MQKNCLRSLAASCSVSFMVIQPMPNVLVVSRGVKEWKSKCKVLCLWACTGTTVRIHSYTPLLTIGMFPT